MVLSHDRFRELAQHPRLLSEEPPDVVDAFVDHLEECASCTHLHLGALAFEDILDRGREEAVL